MPPKKNQQLVVALALIALAVPLIAYAQVVLRSNTYSNKLIAAGDAVLPAGDGIGIPKRSESAHVMLTRDNWPAEGVDMAIEYSFDYGRTWVPCIGLTHIDPGVFDPKLGAIPKAGVGCGWNPDVGQQPTRGRLRTISPSAFRTDISLEYTD